MANKDETITADSFLSSYQVGALLQVNPSSVNKWVKEGRINAFRTPAGTDGLKRRRRRVPQSARHASAEIAGRSDTLALVDC